MRGNGCIRYSDTSPDPWIPGKTKEDRIPGNAQLHSWDFLYILLLSAIEHTDKRTIHKVKVG